MAKKTKTWNKPELIRLGQIANVAGTLTGICQSNNGGNCPKPDAGFS